MGEQSDTGFRWQEIELHEHAKLHHFGTTVNNFPFTPNRFLFHFSYFMYICMYILLHILNQILTGKFFVA